MRFDFAMSFGSELCTDTIVLGRLRPEESRYTIAMCTVSQETALNRYRTLCGQSSVLISNYHVPHCPRLKLKSRGSDIRAKPFSALETFQEKASFPISYAFDLTSFASSSSLQRPPMVTLRSLSQNHRHSFDPSDPLLSRPRIRSFRQHTTFYCIY